MRINHNIAALNTYRQLANNNAIGNKSLEKLSSGLRINRAGDDAAGLAISEKMRAQIRGLDQASRNAQDGISMIQTAEGALNEAHSILQRMRELATQAASDTNVKVDRDEIQKEINQLTSELNRIGNTTEFNTQKLLDGGTTKAAVTTETKGVILTQGTASVTVNVSSDVTAAQVGAVAVGTTTPSGLATPGVSSFSITAALVAGKTLTIDGFTPIDFAAGAGDHINVTAANTEALQAAAIVDYINGKTAAGQVGEKYTASVDGVDPTKIILTQNAGFVSATAATAAVGGGAGAGTVSTVTEDTEGVPAVPGVYTLTIGTAFAEGESITIGGQTFTFGAGADFDVNITDADTAAEQAAALAALIDANATLSARFNAAGVTDNVITLTETTGEEEGTALAATANPAQIAGDYTLELTKMFKVGEQISFGGQTFKAVAAGSNAANGQFAVGTSLESQAESLRAAVEATLGTRFTVTLDGNKLNLVEKAGQATGEDLAITKVGNVQGSISYKHVDASDTGTAAVWNTGALSLLEDGDTGTITFNGFTVNITAADGADATDSSGASNITANSMNITLDTDGGPATAAEQAAKIVELLEANKAGTVLANFTFDTDGDAITITDATNADTGIATNGATNNPLLIGTTGDVVIANTTNATQLTTLGEDAVRAKYTFDITSAFKANEAIEIGGMKFVGVIGEANPLLGQFSISGNKAAQAESLRAAIEANTALNTRYEVTVSDAKVTLTERIAGQEAAPLTAPTTELTKGTAGVYSFRAQVATAGQAYNIDGTIINVVNDADKYREEIAAGTAMLAADNARDQAENLRRAINANETLSAKYTATGSAETVRLTQQEGAESETDPVITIGSQGANGKFIANFQIGANTGQSMTIEISDMRAVALKVSGTEAGVNVVATNGKEASYVAAASVSNGTDNVSVEFALDVSDHTKASAAISVIQDAIEKVSAQRSQLGAYQNRLEHTINNLGTSSENLSAAESRIRDVDMAKEMMEFTKMNILSQAATAMLAQANQQPQAVLQLLGR